MKNIKQLGRNLITLTFADFDVGAVNTRSS
jgi:hypothetical protein